MHLRLAVALALTVASNQLGLQANATDTGLPPGVVNTQNQTDHPLTPEQSRQAITVPEGFHVSLFAGEPHVLQPIDFDFDDRGRLWVVENFSYPDWKKENSDRITILTDTDNDGQFDTRKVFYDQGHRLTSLAYGSGGVWALSPPELLFFPDANGDDVPDGRPVVHLDGWTTNALHNMVNGLTWGPDGWLYGRHGMHTPSFVGAPGTPTNKRTPMDAGIWRYHPSKKIFEVVARGTVNPWGLDYNDVGDLFFSNNVNGHLWHLVPGAVYERTAGVGFAPYAYQEMGYCADHLHFAGANWRAGWVESRGGQGEHGRLGGGHSHVGAMIYLGDNWPARYRNSIFMCNTHGHRINNDRLERRGSGYVGRHTNDFLLANDDWFRGIKINYGPDGGVFVSDWNDLGECHDNDGVHRTSGRIYKIVYGKSRPPGPLNLAALDDARLVQLQLQANDWYVRHARRLLQERAADGRLKKSTRPALLSLLRHEKDVPRQLRALWALHVTGGVDEPVLKDLLRHPSENLRRWAIELGCESKRPPAWLIREYERLASSDPSPMVRLALASALQRMPVGERWDLAEALLAHPEDAGDANLPLLIWYGLEPSVGADHARGLKLLAHCPMPQVRQLISRRLTAPGRSP